MEMHSRVCKCGKKFDSSNDSAKCYDCVLEEITGGNPPEEGDYAKASLISGTLSEQERAWRQKDLESVESGRSSLEPDDAPEYLEWEEDEEDDYDDEEDEDLELLDWPEWEEDDFDDGEVFY